MSASLWIVQFLDYDEGTAARWRDIKSARFASREDARRHKEALRLSDEGDRYEPLYAYRVVEVGSDAYYSQPTDALEY